MDIIPLTERHSCCYFFLWPNFTMCLILLSANSIKNYRKKDQRVSVDPKKIFAFELHENRNFIISPSVNLVGKKILFKTRKKYYTTTHVCLGVQQNSPLPGIVLHKLCNCDITLGEGGILLHTTPKTWVMVLFFFWRSVRKNAPPMSTMKLLLSRWEKMYFPFMGSPLRPEKSEIRLSVARACAFVREVERTCVILNTYCFQFRRFNLAVWAEIWIWIFSQIFWLVLYRYIISTRQPYPLPASFPTERTRTGFNAPPAPLPQWAGPWQDIPFSPSPNRITDTCENITLSRTTYVVSN